MTILEKAVKKELNLDTKTIKNNEVFFTLKFLLMVALGVTPVH